MFLERLAAIMQRSWNNPRTEAEERESDDQSRKALLKQLDHFRRGALARDHQTTSGPLSFSPVPVANQLVHDNHRHDNPDDNPASGEAQPELADDLPATDAKAWFASSTPCWERKHPAIEPALLAN
jgi:hypothetical protein